MIDPTQYRFAGIYRFTNLINGKIYVGQAKNIYKRYRHHAEMNANTRGLFAKALKRYGIQGFTFEVLEQVFDSSLLDEREQYWLDTLKPYLKDVGYNICVSPNSRLMNKVELWNKRRISERNFNSRKGKTGRHQTVETRQKISFKAIGRTCHEKTRMTTSKTFKGIPKTAEENAKRARSLSKPIAQIEPSTDIVVRVWLSAQYAAKKTGLSLCTIRECCTGFYWDSRAKKRNERNPFYAGFNWQYATPEQMAGSSELLINISEFEPRRQKKPVIQTDINTGEIIKIWPSIVQASKELSIGSAGIATACKGYYYCSQNRKNKLTSSLYAGYRWEYLQR